MSSLRRGHANLLCIVPILSDDRRSGSVCGRRCFGIYTPARPRSSILSGRAKKCATAMRFELTHPKDNNLAGYRLNHSATLSACVREAAYLPLMTPLSSPPHTTMCASARAPRHDPNSTVHLQRYDTKAPHIKNSRTECTSRESNPGLPVGNGKFYH